MKITLSKKQWELIGKKTGWIRKATGEADQDYDHAIYDAITNLIKRKTGLDASHKEFDKYQGVYVFVSSIGKIWTADSFVIGKRKAPTAKYRSAILVNPDGDRVSSNRGDYFMQKPDYVFGGFTLELLDFNGKKTIIQNPKVQELPDLLDVQRNIEYESEPDNVLRLQPENEGQTFDVRITPDNKIISDGGLIDYIILKFQQQLKKSK